MDGAVSDLPLPSQQVRFDRFLEQGAHRLYLQSIEALQACAGLPRRKPLSLGAVRAHTGDWE